MNTNELHEAIVNRAADCKVTTESQYPKPWVPFDTPSLIPPIEKMNLCAGCGTRTLQREIPEGTWVRYCPTCQPDLPGLIAEYRTACDAEIKRKEEERVRREQEERWATYRAECRAYHDERIGVEYRRWWWDGTDGKEPFVGSHPSQRDAAGQLRAWATGGYAKQPFAFLYGPTGTGKTTLASIAFRQCSLTPWSDGYHHAIFWRDHAFADAWRRAHQVMDRKSDYAGPAPDELIGEAMEVRVLILDDLLRARWTPNWAAMMFAVIDHREHRQLPTLTTSNFSPAELVGAGVDPALAARLCRWSLHVQGPSMRAAMPAVA